MDWANRFLKNQVRLRDNILYEQKLILDRNKIDRDISYDGLKAFDKVEASLKKAEGSNFPTLVNSNRASAPALGYNRPRRAPLSGDVRAYSGRSSPGTNQRRYPLTGARANYLAARNKCKTFYQSDYRQPGSSNNYTDRRPGARAPPKRGYELPEHLKNRISYPKTGQNPRSILKSSFEDRGLSFNRRLHNAIHQRHNYASSSGGTSGIPSYRAATQKRKVGFAASPEPRNKFIKNFGQAYIPRGKYSLDPKRSPYVQRAETSQEPYETPEALRALKQKWPASRG